MTRIVKSHYTPDKWVVIEINNGVQTYRKILGSWYGGFAGSDSWKLSSAIDEIIIEDDVYHFYNHSGSLYNCHKSSYGMSSYAGSIYQGWVDESEKEDSRVKITLLSQNDL